MPQANWVSFLLTAVDTAVSMPNETLLRGKNRQDLQRCSEKCTGSWVLVVIRTCSVWLPLHPYSTQEENIQKLHYLILTFLGEKGPGGNYLSCHIQILFQSYRSLRWNPTKRNREIETILQEQKCCQNTINNRKGQWGKREAELKQTMEIPKEFWPSPEKPM